MGNKAALPSSSPAAAMGQHHHGAVDRNLQRRMMAGETYNLKIVVRGERGTGKSSLIRRLQEGKYDPGYVPTPEIAAAHVNWGYKCSEATVKVEVWDVVNRAIDRGDERLSGLKGGIQRNSAIDDDEPAGIASTPNKFRGHHSFGLLDASSVDVYKNCDAVVFMVDPKNRETFEFVVREAQNVPKHATMLIIRNFRDLATEDDEVELEDVMSVVQSLRQLRDEGEPGRLELPSGRIDAFDASMKDCFGLKILHSYLNIPFLRLRWASMLRKLEEIKAEHDSAQDEVQVYVESQAYENYAPWSASLEETTAPHQTPKSAPPPKRTAKRVPHRKVQSHVKKSAAADKRDAGANLGNLKFMHASPHVPSPAAPPSSLSARSPSIDDIASFNPNGNASQNALDDFFGSDSDNDDGLSPELAARRKQLVEKREMQSRIEACVRTQEPPKQRTAVAPSLDKFLASSSDEEEAAAAHDDALSARVQEPGSDQEQGSRDAEEAKAAAVRDAIRAAAAFDYSAPVDRGSGYKRDKKKKKKKKKKKEKKAKREKAHSSTDDL